MINRSRKEFLLIGFAIIVATVVEFYTGFIDRFLIAIERLDHLLLTELFVILMVGTIGFGIYSWRRWQEVEQARATNLELQESVNEVKGLNRRYRSYAEAVTHGQEEERQRLARELHDDTIHRLILLNQKVELALYDHPDNPISADVVQMQTILTDTINSIRRFIQELRPTYLDEIGLIPALRMLVEEKRERTGINFQFSVKGAEKRLSADTELTLYRIAQTALRNVFLHAEADHSEVELSFNQQHISLKISDNGIGFDVPDFSDLSQTGNFGLIGMVERAAHHQGTLQIDSQEGVGTVIHVQIPYTTK